MSGRKLKVPSSARRHIKIEQFSSYVSASRLRNVQDILIRKEKAGTKMDAVLCIAGIDSRYNEGSLELLNYLLFGFFEARKDELENSGYPDEIIDDLMILIFKDRVSVYCNPINYHYLLPYISHWPAIQFHCLNEDEYDDEDEDASEEFKIQSLIAMVHGCQIIGIPFAGTGGGPEFNVMTVEKWPIIQAFALDDFGGRGFFTLNYHVTDVSADATLLYTYQDPVSVELLLKEHYPLLMRQWNNVMQGVQMALHDSKTVVLSEKKLSEPLKSYFNHGLVGHKGRLGRVPFVLINSSASQAEFSKFHSSLTDISADATVVVESQDVHSLVCQVVSPNSPLICGRTYFVSKYPFTYEPNAITENKKAVAFSELRYYEDVYLSMLHAVLTAIESYAHSSRVDKAREACLDDLRSCCSQMVGEQLDGYLSKSSNLEFVLDIIGNDNSGIPLVEGHYSPVIKYISLTLFKVPPPQGIKGPGRTLMFAETFLDSRIFVKDRPDVSSDFLIITSTVPRFQLWSADGHSKKLSPQAPRLPADVWGAPLMTHNDIAMTSTWSALLPPEKVTVTFWENGLSVDSGQYGCFTIHGTQMEGVSMYDGNSSSQVVLMSVEVNTENRSLCDGLPSHLLADVDNAGSCQILFAFNPHSKAYTQLYGAVLPAWKEENAQVPSVERPDYLEPDHMPVHSYLQNKLEIVSDSASKASSLKMSATEMPELYSFLAHLTKSSGLHQPVPAHVYQSLTAPEASQNAGNKIVVTVITGAPGSAKETLGTLITGYNTNSVNWLVYKQPGECSIDTPFLHQSMTSAVKSNEQLTTITRMIIIAPGFCDTPAVLGAMQMHPDPKIRSQFVIGAVTVCIDPLNAFLDHKMTLPQLTCHCSQGWVNNIVFTSQTLGPSEVLDKLQTLLRSVNSNVALLKAENGEMKRSTDLDLVMSMSAFEEPDLQLARVLMKPAGESGIPQAWPCNPEMNEVMLKFSQPLEKHLTLIKLRGIKATLKPCPFEGNIYFVRGYLVFSGSPALIDLRFTPLSGKLSLDESKSAPGSGEATVYIVSFMGIGLQEKELKAFLSSCVKQKPEKKKLLTKADLSQKEIDKIHKEHHLFELPEGWFYNGSQFVSMSGERSEKHPGLDGFIQDYLKKKNSDIEKYNSRIEKETYINLFP